MHTSTRLAADDFAYWQLTRDGRYPLAFAEFCADYHELDRVGVVSPALEDGVLQAGRTVLALTTAFYDCLRHRGVEFFDYPQHFAFVGTADAAHRARLNVHTSELWRAWSLLDVWPAHKWITTLPTATRMLQCIFDYQINRLFWPQALQPQLGEEPLPDYAYRMLRTRLKAIYYYGLTDQLDGALPALEVCGSSAVEALMQDSIARLPTSEMRDLCDIAPKVERLQQVSIDEFVTTMQSAARHCQQT